MKYLSCTKIFVCAVYLVCFFILPNFITSVRYKDYAFWVNEFGYRLYVFIMIVILFDRFSLAYFNIKCSIYIRSNFVKITGLVMFLLLLFLLTFEIYQESLNRIRKGNTHSVKSRVGEYVYIGLTCSYLFLAMLVLSTF